MDPATADAFTQDVAEQLTGLEGDPDRCVVHHEVDLGPHGRLAFELRCQAMTTERIAVCLINCWRSASI
ncbi:hypothetical protein ABQF34_29455 [Mycolicibacterium boenickei]